MPEEKKSFSDVFNQVVGEEGIRSDVKVAIDRPTAKKLVLTFLIAGCGIVVVAQVLKSLFPNKDLKAILQKVSSIESTISTP